jgi:ATP-binding cassette subfamily B protein
LIALEDSRKYIQVKILKALFSLSMFKLLLRNLRLAYDANRFYVVALITATFLYAGIGLSALLILAGIIDLFIVYAQTPSPEIITAVWWLFGLLVIRWLVANVCNQFLTYLNEVHKPKVLNYTDNIIIQKLDRLPTEVIESSEFQNYMTNIHTFGKVKLAENLNLISTLIETSMLFLYSLTALLISSPLVALLIIIVAIPEVQYNIKIIRKMRDLNQSLALERRQQSYFTSLTQDISQYFNLKSYNLFTYFLDKIKKSQKNIINGVRDIQFYHKPRGVIIGSIANILGQFLPKAYYVWATLNAYISIGQFQLYYRLVDEAYNNSFRLYMAYLQISENNLYVKDLFSLLDMPEKEIAQSPDIDLSKIKLEFKNVSFIYPESKQYVLKNVSFTVKNGEKLAIVGQNGAGKTTITRLINKFYEPTSGSIFVNGTDLREIDTVQWRSVISSLSQDVPKYSLPIKENITIGELSHKFDKKRYQQSVNDAKIAGDIERLPKQDATMLGKFFPGGVNLSGGQWQKVSIARSFYRNASLLILDEPTSAVDSKAEQEIFNAIFERSTTQAQIIISHKFSNIRKADCIIVLTKGKISESGTHKKLMAEKGEYAKLYNQQSAAFVE